MPSPDRDIGDFVPGDGVWFRRTFAASDFALFSQLSGDRNPLHHDAGYAVAAGYGAPVLPLHLTAAPLSAIAGTMLPGHRSLYLQHNLRALRPARFGVPIDYSARVVAVSKAQRTLAVRAIALQGSDVLFECELTVRVRDDVPASLAPSWDADAPLWPRRPHRVLLTGALGSVGSALALALAGAGRSLLLLHRAPNSDRSLRLVERCRALGADTEERQLDLTDTEAVSGLARQIADSDEPFDIVHAASASMNAPLAAHMAVSYAALREIVAAASPAMLRHQQGAVLLIGSSGLQFHPAGMSDYLAAKAAATDLVAGVEQRYRQYGVRGMVLAPGYIQGAFSVALRGEDTAALLPEEVASTALGMILHPAAASQYVWLEPSGRRDGHFGWYADPSSAAGPAHSAPIRSAEIVSGPAASESHPDERLATLVRQFLALPPTADLASASVDATPGWDSLRHIELILHIEGALGIQFDSSEIDQTTQFGSLAALVARKTARTTAARTELR